MDALCEQVYCVEQLHLGIFSGRLQMWPSP